MDNKKLGDIIDKTKKTASNMPEYVKVEKLREKEEIEKSTNER